MKIIALSLTLLPLVATTISSGATNAWADFYDRRLLVEWGDYVIPGIEVTLKQNLLPNVPDELKGRTRNVQLKFPRDRASVPLNFYSRWDARENTIVLPVTSLRFFRDFCVAYAWLAHHGYSNDTVSDCLTFLAMKWPSESLRNRPHTPLELLGIPSDALEDPAVMNKTLAIFDSGTTFLLGHELGHLASRHPAYATVSAAAARANEAQADEFALDLMGQIGQPPLGVPFLFTMFSHLQLEQLDDARTQAEHTHPLNADRIGNVARWLDQHGDYFTRGTRNPARASAELKGLIAELRRITNGLASPGVHNLLRLRGLTAQPDGLKPRRIGEPRIPVRAPSGRPARRWDGVFAGSWSTAAGDAIETEMQLTPTAGDVRGFYTFGAGRVELLGELEKDELHFTWTLDGVNRGTGVLRSSEDGSSLTGTWRRDNDGYTANWNLRWRGYPVAAVASAPMRDATALRDTPERVAATGAEAETGLGFGGSRRPNTAANAPARTVSQAELERAIAAVLRADDYVELVTALKRHVEILGTDSAVALIEKQGANGQLNDTGRGQLNLFRALCQDCRDRGADLAAQLFCLRLIAGSALVANTPRQLANVMEKFPELARLADAKMVRAALDTPGNSWPKGLLPLMEQLAVDWRQSDALTAATRMERAARQANQNGAATDEAKNAEAGSALIGHWRRTYIRFESARDEHLVLRADGTAERWTATAAGAGTRVSGVWKQTDRQINVRWKDGSEWSKPIGFHGRELILRTGDDKPPTWERIQ